MQARQAEDHTRLHEPPLSVAHAARLCAGAQAAFTIFELSYCFAQQGPVAGIELPACHAARHRQSAGAPRSLLPACFQKACSRTGLSCCSAMQRAYCAYCSCSGGRGWTGD